MDESGVELFLVSSTISMTKQLGHLSQMVTSTLSMIIETLLSPLSSFQMGKENQHIKSVSLFSLL